MIHQLLLNTWRPVVPRKDYPEDLEGWQGFRKFKENHLIVPATQIYPKMSKHRPQPPSSPLAAPSSLLPVSSDADRLDLSGAPPACQPPWATPPIRRTEGGWGRGVEAPCGAEEKDPGRACHPSNPPPPFLPPSTNNNLMQRSFSIFTV